jgi:transcriptional regulator with XRE-family HTH domain
MKAKARGEAPGDHPARFAERLNKLFEAHRSPDGDEYTLTEVRDATKGLLSIAYLSMLRSGGITRPRLDKVQLLADFFGVSVSYFTGSEGTPETEISDALRRALAEPEVRELALRAGELAPEERALYLRLLDYAKEVATRIRVEETTAPGDKPDADTGVQR